MNRFRNKLLIVIALIISMATVRCSKTHVTAADSKVMLINASPDAPTGIDLLGNGQTIVSNVAFGDSSVYTPNLTPGTYGMKITKANQPADSLFSFIATWLPGRYYSVFAVDTFNNIRPSILEDVFRPDSVYARMRILYLCPDGRTLNIYVRARSDSMRNGVFKTDTLLSYSPRVFNDQNVNTIYGNFASIKTKRDTIEIRASLYHQDTTAQKDTVILSQQYIITRKNFYTFYLAGFYDSTRASAANKLHLELIEHVPQ